MHLVRLESMVTVGCKFAPGDLTPREWDELIVLSQERQMMSERVRKQKEAPERRDSQARKKTEEARKAAGVPPPGSSLFPRKKPMR